MLSFDDQNIYQKSSQDHWHGLRVSHKLLSIGLLLMVFVLPVSLIVISQSTELRNQAQVSTPR